MKFQYNEQWGAIKDLSRGLTGLNFHPKKLNLPADLQVGKAFWPVGFLSLPFPPDSI